MKSQERDLMHKLSLITNKSFWEAPNQYSYYDCETSNAIVELKVRGKVYAEKLIELSKMARNLQISEEIGKSFVYVVQDPSGIYYANVSEMSRQILMKEPSMIPCPVTTEFGDNRMVDKACYTIKMTKIQ